MIRFPVGDSHVHSHHSVDAKGSLSEICHAAFERGLYEVTITNHYEIMPSSKNRMGCFRFGEDKVEANSDSVKRLTEEIREVGEEFFPAGVVWKLAGTRVFTISLPKICRPGISTL